MSLLSKHGCSRDVIRHDSSKEDGSLTVGTLFAELVKDQKGSLTDLRIISVNRVFASLFRIEAERLSGTMLSDLSEGSFLPLTDQLRRISSGTREISFHTKDPRTGRHIGYEVVMVRNDECVISCSDITGIRSDRYTASRRDRDFRILFEKSPAGKILITGDLQIQCSNPAICSLLGYDPEGLSGLPLETVIHPEDLEQLRSGLRDLSEGTLEVKTSSYRYLHRDGSVRWCGNSTIMINEETDSQSLYLTVINDITQAREDQEMLRYLQIAIESTTEAIGISTKDGKHLYQNEAFTRLFGYTLEEIEGSRPSAIYHSARESEEVFSAIMHGSSWDGELIMQDKQGRSFPVYLRADSIKDERGNITGLIGMHRDISQDLRARETVELQHRKTMTMFDAIEGVMYVSDPVTYELVFINSAFQRLWGLTNEDIPGRKCYEILQQRDKPCEFCTNDIIFKEHPDKTHIWEFQNQVNGRWYRCSDRAIEWVDGRRLRMELALDITEEKTSELKLIESEERYKLISKASANGIWDWWVDEGIIYYSDQWKEQLGYAPDEIENSLEAWTDHIHPDQKQRVLSFLDDFFAHPQDSFSYEFDIRHKDGSYRKMISKASAIRDEQGHVVRLLGTHTDITDRQKADQEKRHLEEQLRQSQKLESIGLLAGGIAHDFNNILTALFGYNEMALLETREDSSMMNYLTQTSESLEQAKVLVQQILAFSRKELISPKVLELNSMISTFNNMLRRILGEDIELDFSFEDTSTIYADPAQIQQVIMNLVLNAGDAIRQKEGSLQEACIRLRTRHCRYMEDRQISQGVIAPGEYIVLTVSDNGSGIPEELQEKIFEPFFTTKGVGEGTGLGLSTVYGIVRQNSGYIGMESELNRGTTFSIYWPYCRKHSSQEEPDRREQHCRGSGQRVLVVEDDRSVRHTIITILEQADYRVLACSNGQEALELYLQSMEDFQLIISDVRMPKMGGLELYERIRENSPEQQILLCTGYTDDPIFTDELPDTVGLIGKPFNKKELLRQVSLQIEHRQIPEEELADIPGSPS